MIKNGKLLLLLLIFFIPGIVEAADVYLKDGGVIKCLYAKKQGDIVYVLVNRDTEVALDSRVVAIKKTFLNRQSIGKYR
jgi:hypothetical protein